MLFVQIKLTVQSFLSVLNIFCCLLITGPSLMFLCLFFSAPNRDTCPNSIKAQLSDFLAHYFLFSFTEQLDRIEVVRLTSDCCDQRHSSGHGSDGARGQSAKGSKLESSKDDDGQSRRVPGCSDKLQQGEHSRGLPQSHSTIPSGKLFTSASVNEDQFIPGMKHLLLIEKMWDLNIVGRVTSLLGFQKTSEKNLPAKKTAENLTSYLIIIFTGVNTW